jgi:hypothetical protein
MGKWERKKREGDLHDFYKIWLSGSNWGASWNGRVDIYAEQSFQIGDFVSFEEIQAFHQVRDQEGNLLERTETHNYIRLASPDPREVEDVEIVDTWGMKDDDDPLDPSDLSRYMYKYQKSQHLKLVWETCQSKTTLSGEGRQYKNQLVGVESALWKRRLNGSGRAYTNAVLALVKNEGDIFVQNTLDA